jgi:hypothetical protein
MNDRELVNKALNNKLFYGERIKTAAMIKHRFTRLDTLRQFAPRGYMRKAMNEATCPIIKENLKDAIENEAYDKVFTLYVAKFEGLS